MTLDNHHYQRLAQIQQRYQDKRTLGYRLVDDCIQLVEAAVAEHEAHLQGRVDQAERYVENYRDANDRLRGQITRMQAMIEEKRTLTEKREQAGEEVQVTIARSLSGWQVSDLEEIAYRLRCGGAVDETPVKVTDYTATAKVPAPDLVRLERPSTRPALPTLPDPLANPTLAVARTSIDWRLGLALAIFLASVVLGVVVL